MQQAHKILGIDPGSKVTGFALLASKRSNACHPSHFTVLDAGVLRSNPAASLMARISALHLAMEELMNDCRPHVCVLETAFVGKNIQSALKLGQVRGALICSASRLQIPTEELSPTQVKKIVTGYGHSDKKTVLWTLEQLLGFNLGSLPLDASDALAIALSFAVTPQ